MSSACSANVPGGPRKPTLSRAPPDPPGAPEPPDGELGEPERVDTRKSVGGRPSWIGPHWPSFSFVRDWTLEAATDALPRVRETVGRIRELVGQLRERADHPGGSGDVGGNGTKPSSNGRSRGAGVKGESAAERELRVLLEELTDDGIVVRDPERGLIDFPARSPGGRPYLLCWLHGEDAIEWWHWPDAGFAGRTPLTEPPD